MLSRFFPVKDPMATYDAPPRPKAVRDMVEAVLRRVAQRTVLGDAEWAPKALFAPPSTPSTETPVAEPPLLVFDTETTGFSPPIVCQIAWSLVENNEAPKEESYVLSLPAGVSIDPHAQAVHGITPECVGIEGVDALPILGRFLEQAADVVARGGRVVAHNATFDTRAILTTIRYWHQPAPRFPRTFCTMLASKAYSPLKTKADRAKAFKNDELYIFFNEKNPTEKLHDALGDVRITLSNYQAGKARGWW